jgi:hypothetical protein
LCVPFAVDEALYQHALLLHFPVTQPVSRPRQLSDGSPYHAPIPLVPARPRGQSTPYMSRQLSSPTVPSPLSGPPGLTPSFAAFHTRATPPPSHARATPPPSHTPTVIFPGAHELAARTSSPTARTSPVPRTATEPRLQFASLLTPAMTDRRDAGPAGSASHRTPESTRRGSAEP